MILLKTEKLTKRFGELVAVDQVDLKVEEGSLHSVIGPNGAGKTTLFNLISGELQPSAGNIVFREKEITGFPPHKIPHLGIGRSFQRTNIFPKFTVFDNVWVAAFFQKAPQGLNVLKKTSAHPEIAEKVNESLAEVGLAERANQLARELSHGDQRLLEVAIALAASPSFLLLDEPTSGLSPDETRRMMEFIKKLSKRYTILIIEHKMSVVMSISDKITVMHFGRIIAEGSPQEIQANESVRQAYLGGRR